MSTSVPPVLTVTICGGGNGAHASAAYIASKTDMRVNVLTRRPKEWSTIVNLTTAGTSWSHKGIITGKLNKVTDDPAEVIPESDIIIVAAPANAHPPILRKISAHVPDGCMVGALYAQGGFDWAAKAALGDKLKRIGCLFGLQNIPWICKTTTYGREVKLIGPKKVLWAAASPVDKTAFACKIVAQLYGIHTKSVPNFMSLTLTPSNQIIHPPRYYGIFKDWDGKTPMKKEQIQWGLYTEMDEVSADMMGKLDNELQAIRKGLCDRFPTLDLSYVMPLGPRILFHYGADVKDTRNLQTIFRSNQGYAGCVTPTKAVDGGFIPAVESRLFWEDIPYGLCILKNIAEMLGQATPTLDFLTEWHQQYMGKVYIKNGKLNKSIISETAAPLAYGITTLEDLVAASLPSSSTSTAYPSKQNARSKL